MFSRRLIISGHLHFANYASCSQCTCSHQATIHPDHFRSTRYMIHTTPLTHRQFASHILGLKTRRFQQRSYVTRFFESRLPYPELPRFEFAMA
jgi:hypothetical protein